MSLPLIISNLRVDVLFQFLNLLERTQDIKQIEKFLSEKLEGFSMNVDVNHI